MDAIRTKVICDMIELKKDSIQKISKLAYERGDSLMLALLEKEARTLSAITKEFAEYLEKK